MTKGCLRTVNSMAGETINNPAANPATNPSNITYSTCLLSTLLGSLGNHYIPLYGLDANIQLKLYFANSGIACAFKTDSAQANFSYSNIVFNANMIQLSEKAMATIGPPPLLFYGTGWYNQQATSASATMSCQILTQFHYTSMKWYL